MCAPADIGNYQRMRGPSAHKNHKRANTATGKFSEPYFNYVMGKNTRMTKGADMVIRGSTLNQTANL
tara:strand:- start:985 stop:1185 length:201 start_codon:yes stop_codon:yes gene_type:complete